MYKRFAELLERHDISAYRVAKSLKMSPTTFSDWKKGKSHPKIEKLNKIAEYFNVPITYFTDVTDMPLDEIIHKSDNISGIMETDQLHRLPIIGEVHAGSPILTNEIIEGYECADIGTTDGDYYYLRVVGDSMINAGIMPQSLVLIKRQDYADPGQIVVCMTDEESATLKRFSIDGSNVILLPENEAYDPIILPLKDFVTGKAHILGIALEVKIKL